MIYIITGEEEVFIRDKIASIIKENGNEVTRFDGRAKDFSIDEMVEACMGRAIPCFLLVH